MTRALIAAASSVVASFVATNALAQIAPPPPIAPNAQGSPNAPPANTPTDQQLNDAEKKDSGRGLEFLYLGAEGGFSYINMTSFNDSSFALQRTDAAGGMLGVGAGLRLLVLTIGASFRYNMLSAFNLGQLEAVVGLHIPAGMWDPYLAVRGGYDFVGSLGDGAAASSAFAKGNSPSDISVHGGNFGISGGVDYYIVKFFSLGIDGTFDILFLKRPPLALPAGVDPAFVKGNPLYENSGSSAGYGFIASAHAALHF